jgi:YVTN family beta-propeller protein
VTAVHAQWLETKIRVGNDPDGQLYVPSVNKVYCANTDDNTVSVIDCATNTVVATIATPSYPIPLTWSDAYERVYIACDESNRIIIVDAVGDTVVARLSCDGGPSSATYCSTLGKVYVMCFGGGKIDVIDAAGDSMLTAISVPLDGDAIDWCPTSNLVFFSNDRRDSLTVIDCVSDELRAVHAGSSAFQQVLWNPRDNRVYTVLAWVIYVFSNTGETLVDSIVHPAYTPWCCFAPYPNKCFIGDFNTGMIYVTDCNTRSITDSIQTGQVYSMVLDSLCGKIYVVQSHDGVAVLDARGDSIITEVPFTQYPSGPIAWSARERRVYVPGYYTDTLYVIRDTTLGIAEATAENEVRAPNAATVVRNLPQGAVAFDAMGRRVVTPRAGIYFVRDEGRGAGDASRTRKVVIQR